MRVRPKKEPEFCCTTASSPSDCFVSYTGRSLEESYPSAKMPSVYAAATATADLATLVEIKKQPKLRQRKILVENTI